ncbi:NUDIX domain-containing protein [Cellulophaga sp. 1_MG-2023]|nr:NUDIX domain-containing protein [Cellulophaga sp. 1_MG-2023]MDO6768389.1 NUDIX domain-containing protein [Cellulophaga sp. 1_MG-2023]
MDYYVEPTEQIIDKLAWIRIENHQILSIQAKGKTKFYIPGGKRKNGEKDKTALLRQVKENLDVAISPESIEFIGVFEAQAAGKKPGILVRLTCYSGSYSGKLKAGSEIEKYTWLNYDDKEKVSEVDKLIFDYLYHKGILA